MRAQAAPPSQTAAGWFQPLADVTPTTVWLAGSSGAPSYLDGEVHLGVDLHGPQGTAVYAIGAGTVISVQSGGQWGSGNKAVAILHHSASAGDFVAIYGHVRSTLLKGESVVGGQQIGTTGPLPISGPEGGAHLHFGIHPGNTVPVGSTAAHKGWGAESLNLYQSGDTNGFVDPLNWIDTRPADSAASPTPSAVTITDSTPTLVPLIGIREGDIVRVTVTLTTATDPNEDGEGELLQLRSSGGFFEEVATYNQTVSLTFTATQDAETLTAAATGNDSDESAVVSADFGNVIAPAYSSTQKASYAKLSSDLGIEAAGLGAVSVTLALSGAGAAYAPAFALGAALAGLESQAYNRLALDPPDPNYKSIARPAREPHLRLSIGTGLAASEARALSALQSNEEQAFALAAVASTTSDRASGALAAGDLKWERKQLAALSRYKKLESVAFRTQGTLLRKATAVLGSGHFSMVSISPQDALDFEQSVLDGGLPAGISMALAELRVDAATTASIRQALFVQDTAAVAGTFPSDLARADVLLDLAEASDRLAR